jgi:hypothetical protein
MERLRFIDHRQQRILYFDLADILEPEEVLPILERGKELCAASPPHSLLTLTNVRNTRFNTATVAALKRMVEHNRPYIRASAVVGMSSLHRIIYSVIVRIAQREIPAFDDEDRAKAWLVSKA